MTHKNDIHHLKEELTLHIENVIDRKVNGKVESMQKNLADYIEKDMEWKVADAKWKEQVEPVLKIYRDSDAVKRFIWTAIKWISAFAGVFAAFEILKK
jgi:hypothetical protein